jgi:DNA-directed RNA polymerase specialized sigma24 family protein
MGRVAEDPLPYITACYGLAVAMLGPGADAEQAVTVAFARVARSQTAGAALTQELLTATRRAAKEHLRAARSIAGKPGTARAVANPGFLPHLTRWLTGDVLTVVERNAVLLMYFGCYTFAEVAALTQTTTADVRHTVVTAARKLIAASNDLRLQDEPIVLSTAARIAVEQAKGLLMQANNCGPREALAMLTAQSARTGRTVSDIATEMVNEAARPATAGTPVDDLGDTPIDDAPGSIHQPVA